jgi:hypothetical protein
LIGETWFEALLVNVGFDYVAAAREGGFEGDTIVGEDLATLRLPAN